MLLIRKIKLRLASIIFEKVIFSYFTYSAYKIHLFAKLWSKVARGLPLNLAPHCFLLCLITPTPIHGRNTKELSTI